MNDNIGRVVEFWQKEFGDVYHERNDSADIEARFNLWLQILSRLNPWPDTILEIGAGTGTNLRALHRAYHRCRGDLFTENHYEILGIDPNAKARAALQSAGFGGYEGTAAKPGRKAELVFTSGVLIHIPPDELMAACRGIYNAAERYIVAIEYFSHEPVAVKYRGHVGKLWKRDYGAFYLDMFPDLKVSGTGFAWKRTTGLDNLNWWAFSKC